MRVLGAEFGGLARQQGQEVGPAFEEELAGEARCGGGFTRRDRERGAPPRR